MSTFLLEQQLWQRLGLRREDLLSRPAREVEDYVLFIQLIVREEQAQQRRAASRAR